MRNFLSSDDDDPGTDTANDDPIRNVPVRKSQLIVGGSPTPSWMPTSRNSRNVFWTMPPNDDSIRHALFMAIQMTLSLTDPIFLGFVDIGYSMPTTPLS
jgi:hypothetical protein